MARFAPRILLSILLVLGLAACQSSEERAEEHYQNALRLIEEGDYGRASVEFRNVFQNNGQHRDARARYAELLRETGDLQGAYSQYLRLAEQYPGDGPSRVALTEMAIDTQNWEEARRHGERALTLAPEDPAIPTIAVNLDYAAAVEDEDLPARRAAVDQVAQLMETEPDNLRLRRILVDSALREGNFPEALEEIDAALALAPEDRSLYDIRLVALIQLEDAEAIEEHLRTMIGRFPTDTELQTTLLRFYVSRGQVEQAEGFLREIASTSEDGEVRRDAQTALIRLALEQDGVDAALAEIDTILAGLDAEDNGAAFRALRAGIIFDDGQRDAAIAEMETILEQDLATGEAGRLRVALAQMLVVTGNQVGAQALVEEVLAADATQVDALKLKAGWLIESDQTREAIALLRTALEQDPQDATAMTLSAQAHLRNGDRNLAREFLARAVEAANSAPEETVRYAEFLAAEERYLAAEEVLIDALRLTPGNLALLGTLGQVYVAAEDWSRAEQVETTLRRQDGDAPQRLADSLQASRLASQGRMEEAVTFLENLASAAEGDQTVEIAVVRARLANGDAEGALDYIDSLLATSPDNFIFRFLRATTQVALGDNVEARQTYRDLLSERPQVEQLWIGLIRTFNAEGDVEGAEAALEEGLEVLPTGINLLWAQASFAELRGDYEGAIALYEQMYERAPNEAVVANNLASLISTYRDDEASLERAYTVSRRLRDSDFAPFQDTYGWIAYRRGDYQEALENLESAAATLSNDPLVQFHLAMTYVALDRPEEALEQFRTALDLIGPDETRSQFDTARQEVERLEAALAGDDSTTETDGAATE